MFEQTLLTHPATARKTGALAASFLAQTAVAGVLFVGPLLYTQALPLVLRVPDPLWIANKPVTPPPVVTEAPSNARPSRGPSTPWAAPVTIPRGPIRTDVVIDVDLGPQETPVVGATLDFIGPRTGVTALPAPVVIAELVKPAPVPVIDAPPARVSGGAQAAKLLTQVVPTYPALALRMRVSGAVHLLGIIAKDGRIRDLRVLDGHPMLRQAALEAVRQWVYSPTVLTGQPVEVEAPIDVVFTMR
jgi:protein TonB